MKQEQQVKRVACFVDGLNLYHSLKENHQKWLDLVALTKRLSSGKSEFVSAVHYFSAYAKWLPDSHKRHQEYVNALEAIGVDVVLGHFKKKDKQCRVCGSRWRAHEEKETDVNIALHMLDGAYEGNYDKAILITRDGDLAPVLRLIRRKFPNLEIEVVAPPHLRHSSDLIGLATSKKKIRVRQIEDCLLPRQVVDPQSGEIAATRPAAYTPPKISPPPTKKS